MSTLTLGGGAAPSHRKAAIGTTVGGLVSSTARGVPQSKVTDGHGKSRSSIVPVATSARPAARADEILSRCSPALTRLRMEAQLGRMAVSLDRCRNNRLRATAELEARRVALYNKLCKYGLVGQDKAIGN